MASSQQELPRGRHEEFSQFFRYAPIGLCLVDRQSRYVRVNERLAEMNGRGVEEHLGRTPAEILPDTAALSHATLRAVLEGGEALYEIESSTSPPARPGEKQWRLENWCPLRSAEGEVWGALGAVMEITQRKRREESLCQAKTEAEAERAANQQFAERLSYDMRAPLTAILGFAELLAEPQLSPEQSQSYAEDIQRNAQTLLKLVNSILEEGRRRLVESPQPAVPAVPPRILLAEDTLDSQKLFKTILEKAGLQVDVAPDGLVALDWALATFQANRPYDLILMDMQMPGLDGFEVTRRLRAAGWRQPILALTGFATTEDRQRCLGAGCDEHLPKPVTRQTLLAAVRNYVPLPTVPAAETSAPRSGYGLVDDAHLTDDERDSLLAGFHENLPGYLHELAQALRGQDRERLVQTAHRLAGVAGLYGFRALEQAASRLEHRAADQAGWPELGGLVQSLRVVIPPPAKPTRVASVAPPAADVPPPQVIAPLQGEVEEGSQQSPDAGELGRGPIRILLAEDDALVRAGVRAVLDALPHVQVVAVACNGREAVELAQKYRPDIALMDITMPELDGLNATAQLAEASPLVKVIMLSVHTREDCVLQAMRVGARGYLLKSTPPDELERALQAVMRGEPYLCSGVSEHVVTAFLEQHGTRQSAAKRPTARQLEILKLIAEGYSTKMIASELGISVKTADRHRSDLMKLLDIHETASLVRYAVRMGLVSAEG